MEVAFESGNQPQAKMFSLTLKRTELLKDVNTEMVKTR
jgi:hypothetical protein